VSIYIYIYIYICVCVCVCVCVLLDGPFFPDTVYLKHKGLKNIKDVNLY
jgi:hypothetical protein